MTNPLISVVTPFRNTASYLAECIESVISQNYEPFEYILSDNCSSDGSLAIAESYAARDPRIRVIRQPQLLSQVSHYNRALSEISRSSQFCKIVQADDSIFCGALTSMAEVFRKSDRIGLVSSYYLKGSTVRGSGLAAGIEIFPGKEIGRMYLNSGVFVFGSPTTVMYRSSLIRDHQLFFDESLLHEDSEKCMQILEEWDFGFVHQVLSFLRTDNESISSAVRDLQPDTLDWFIITNRYAPKFLDNIESANLIAHAKKLYYEFLARAALRFRGSAFWEYQQKGLKTLETEIDRPFLFLQITRELLWMLVNPGQTIRSALNFRKRDVDRNASRA